MYILIKIITGKIVEIETNPDECIETLKHKIQDKTQIMFNQQKLIFNRKPLEDKRLLSYYKIDEGNLVYLVNCFYH